MRHRIYYLNHFFIFILGCFIIQLVHAKANTIIISDVRMKPQKYSVNQSAPRMQITHLSRKQIANSPVTNLATLFQQEQSIIRLTNNSGDNSQTALSLRGFGDNAAANSLILVDGFPLTNPSLLAPNFNSIPLSDIERIEIFQGSEGTLWGDQAVGGVVNIITRHPNKLLLDAILGVGSFHKNDINLLSGNQFSNGFFVKVYGLISKTDNDRAHNQQNSNSVAAYTGIDYTGGSLSLNLQSYGNKTNYPGGLSEAQFRSHPHEATNDKNNSEYRTESAQLLSKIILNDKWLLETRLTSQETRGRGFVFAPFNRLDSVNRISPRLKGTIHHVKVTAGYDGQHSRYHLSQRQVHSRANATQKNIYAQAIIPISENVDITVGTRAAMQSNQVATIPLHTVNALQRVRVSEQGIAYHPNNEWSFFLRRDGNFRFPKANELTLLPANTTRLQAQTGTSYEAGVKWQRLNQQYQINLYHLALANEIAFNPVQTTAQPFGAFNNLAKTMRNGVTLTAYYRFTPSFVFDGQINYVDARFASGANKGKLIPAVPALNGNLGLDYEITSKWQAKYALLYTGSQFASDDTANAGKKVAAYWLHDAAIQYHTRLGIISVEINNLFNQAYSAYTYYNPDTKANTFYPGNGRSYLLTFKMQIA